MARIVSVWLPRWPILRFLTTQARSSSSERIDPDQPFVLAVEASGGPRIAALNKAAEHQGLAVGELLADARAKSSVLQVRALDPAADEAALRQLALWATRYTPAVSPWQAESGNDGFFLDITGAAHLFGGEKALLADLTNRLARFGLPARLAVADTAGTAWALSHFHDKAALIVPSGQEVAALSPLPIEALRLSSETSTLLRRLGLKRVGLLIDKPRAPFAARFEKELLRHLDRALGRAAEPFALIAPPPVYHSLRYLLEPIATQEAVVAVARRLMQDIVHALVRDDAGAQTLRLALYRVDGEVTTVDIGLTLPTRDIAHVTRLLDFKLERLGEAIDAGLGFEALGLAVTIAEPMTAKQMEIDSVASSHDAERCAALIDSLRQRLGPRSVQRLQPVASHIPERAEAASVASAAAVAWPAADDARPRPLLLLPSAEPADVIAFVPEGPPKRFRWRGVVYDIARAQGPERIASEWWRSRTEQPTRDYYFVEDDSGRRFWLYREGLYGRETAAPRWFVHGLFA
jgi:protein ImuB